MSDNRDACIDDTPYGIYNLLAAFQLQRIHACLGHHANSIADTLFTTHLIGAEGHIANHHGPLGAACHAAAVINHLVYGDGQCSQVTCHHIAGTVAHQDDIHTCAIDDLGHCIIISCQHGNLLAILLHLNNFLSSNFLCILNNISCHFLLLFFFCDCKVTTFSNKNLIFA